MHIFLWVLQVLMALHTAMGAVWKFSNSEQSVPTLKAIPHGVWLGMGGLELLAAVALVLPVLNASFGKVTPYAASFIVVEMVFMTIVHFASGSTEKGSPIYWLVVAAICAFLAYGRFVLKPF